VAAQPARQQRKHAYVSSSTVPYLRTAIEEPLKREINQLKRTILELARDPKLVYEAQEKVMGESEPWVWQTQAIKAILEHVTRGPLVELPPPNFYRHVPGVITIGHARVPCPLCGAGREPFTYQEDETNTIGTYSVPTGLERHLAGYRRIRQCPIMAAARDLAREAWDQNQKSLTPQHEG